MEKRRKIAVGMAAGVVWAVAVLVGAAVFVELPVFALMPTIMTAFLAPGLVMSEGVVSKGVWAGEKLKANLSSRAIQRESEPDDILGALIFLASNESAFVTGQTLVIDGGSVMH